MERIINYLSHLYRGKGAPCILMVSLLLIPVALYHGVENHTLHVTRISLWDWLQSNALLCISAAAAACSCWVCVRRACPLMPAAIVQWKLIFLSAAWVALFDSHAYEFPAQFPLCMLFLISFWLLGRALLGRFSYIVWGIALILLIVIYAAHLNGFVLSYTNLMEVFCTSWQDAKPYFTVYTISLAVIGVAVALLAFHLVYRTICKESRWTLLFCGLTCWLGLLVAIRPIEHHMDRNSSFVWPLGEMEILAYNSARAIYEMNQVEELMECMPPIGSTHSSFDTVHGDAGVICIMHVGESLLADHLSINGYERETTPWLASCPNLVNYKDCVASADMTDKAILTILTNGRRNFLETRNSAYRPSSCSLMDFFAAGGFQCASFWSSGIFQHAAPLFKREADFFVRCSADNFDIPGGAWNQIPYIVNYLAKHRGKNCYIMINNMGSHVPFTYYNHENPRFTPVHPPSPDDTPGSSPDVARNMLNAYDNTVHYTDEYIRRLLESLKGRPYLYVFVSDHGEYLGHGGYWLRVRAPHDALYKSSVCQVAFFVIASPEFENMHPHFKQAMDEVRKHQSMSVAHEHVFHTVLGIMGIKTPFYDATLDLSNPQVQPYTGPHPSRGGEPLPGSE